jgi:hypothetical protein
MKDPAFIQEIFTRGRQAGDIVNEAFTNLSTVQLNWSSTPETWSIGHCLDHLVVSDSLYFPVFKQLTTGNPRQTWWQNWNPFSNIFGKMLISQTGEKVNKKVKSPKVFRPSAGPVDSSILPRFREHLDTHTNYIADCRHLDLDKVQITSPVSTFITYSLRSAIVILVQHEHRHVNQAVHVMQHPGFPTS